MKWTAAAPVRLICLPHAGASEVIYQTWRRQLPPWVQTAPALLPGRGRRSHEAPVDDCRLQVARLADELLPTLRGPFALFGHSMGALLAFELAHELRERAGLTPQVLCVAGSVAPSRRRADPAWTGDDAALLGTVRRLNGTPSEFLDDPCWQELALPILRADFQLCAGYRYQARPPLACPLHVFVGRDDPATRRADDLAPWCRETAVGGALHSFDGGHFFLREQQDQVLRLIATILRGLGQRPGTRAKAPAVAVAAP